MADKPKPPPEDDAPGVPEWVVTYGDMMSLLLTFFIMLVSMSELKQDGSMRAMLDSIRQTFGATDGPNGVPGKSNQSLSSNHEASSNGRRGDGSVEESGRGAKGSGGPNLTVERLSHNSVITLGGPGHFDRFSADVTPNLRDKVERLGRLLTARNMHIIVRGHASPEPLPESSSFASPMELSFARANAVTEVLIEAGISRDRLIVSAAGDSEPRTRSRVQSDQTWNRRVDIFLADSYITPASESSESTGVNQTSATP